MIRPKYSIGFSRGFYFYFGKTEEGELFPYGVQIAKDIRRDDDAMLIILRWRALDIIRLVIVNYSDWHKKYKKSEDISNQPPNPNPCKGT